MVPLIITSQQHCTGRGLERCRPAQVAHDKLQISHPLLRAKEKQNERNQMRSNNLIRDENEEKERRQGGPSCLNAGLKTRRALSR